MPAFTPQDPNYQTRIKNSFEQQTIMSTIGAKLIHIAPGKVHIEMPFQDFLCQQDGFHHAGITTTLVDSACGYAAFTLMPAFARVLTIEYKVNFLRPAIGDHFLAIGKVLKPGKKVTVCLGEVLAYYNGEEKVIASMLATMITV